MLSLFTMDSPQEFIVTRAGILKARSSKSYVPLQAWKNHVRPIPPNGKQVYWMLQQDLNYNAEDLGRRANVNWKRFVPQLVHAYNCTWQHTTGLSPYFVMYGRQPRLAADVLLHGSSISRFWHPLPNRVCKGSEKNGWKPRTKWPRRPWKRQHLALREIMTSRCVEQFQKKAILSWSYWLVWLVNTN